MAVRVPNNRTFSLRHVWAAVKDHTPGANGALRDCFSKSIDDYFDSSYKGAKDRMSNFRNYGPGTSMCGVVTEYNGGQVYPYMRTIDLGSSQGWCVLHFDAFSLPDRIIIIWNNNVVLDTGYRGASGYRIGEALRGNFVNSLYGRIDPVLLTTYPDFTNFPNDGYPQVGINDTFSFEKTANSPYTADVYVYGPMATTLWTWTLGCPFYP